MNVKALIATAIVASVAILAVTITGGAGQVVREYFAGRRSLAEVTARAEVDAARTQADSMEKIALIKAAGGGWMALNIVLVGGFGLAGLGMILGFLAWRERKFVGFQGQGWRKTGLIPSETGKTEEVEYQNPADMPYAGYIGEMEVSNV